MANNIALTLTVDGVQQTITTISQLEEAIRAAKEQLSGLQIGSEEFKKLSAQIQQADSALKNLQESVEGKKLEETVGNYAKVGAAITGSFAAAQAAVNLFGGDAEKVSQAAIQAQNLLTLALTAREVAEGAVAVKAVANSIATTAEAAAATAANAATKAFYTTLAANPYTAILLVIGAVVAAVITLKDSFKTLTEEQKRQLSTTEIQAKNLRQLNAISDKEILTLQNQVTVLKNSNTRRTEANLLLTELKDQYPELNKLQGDENALIERAIQLIELKIEQRRNQILVDQILTKQAELLTKINDINNKSISDSISWYDELINRVKTLSFSFVTAELVIANAETAQRNNAEATNAAQQEYDNYQKQLNSLLPKLGETTTKLNKLGGTTKDTSKQQDAYNALIERYVKQLDAINKELVNRESLEGKLGDTNAKVIQQLEERLNLARELANVDKEASFSFEKALTETLTNTKPLVDNLALEFENLKLLLTAKFEGADSFKQISVVVDEATGKIVANEETIKTSTVNLNQLISSSFTKLREAASKSTVGTELLADIETFSDNYSMITTDLEGQSKEFKDKVSKDYVDLLIAQKKLVRDPYERTAEQIGKDLTNVQERFSKTQQELVNIFAQQGEAAFRKANKNLKGALDTKVTEKILENAKLKADQFFTRFENTVAFEQGVTIVLERVKEINAELQKLTPEQVTSGFFLKYSEELLKITEFTYKGVQVQGKNLEDYNKFLSKKILSIDEDLAKGRKENFEQYSLDIKDLEEQLKTQGIDITTLSEEAKLELLKKYLQKQIDETTKAEEEKTKIEAKEQEKRKERLDKFSEGIQEFQGVLNSLSQTTSDYYNFQLEQLDKQNKKIQESIVGDSEEANKKRLEADKIYQRERAKLEKKAAKTALQISLAQAIANTAEAITKTIAAYGGTPVAFVAAALVAALSAVQVGIIGAQLSAIDQYQRGGRIRKGQGGMVVGPSHEYGGVRYAYGGGVELEGGEAVINRVSTVRYAGLLSQINQTGGGKPISVSNFDDSRIVEAIAKQRNEPIRAYVVESDITNKQSVSKRLDQLARI